jgi:hypothetical protein
MFFVKKKDGNMSEELDVVRRGGPADFQRNRASKIRRLLIDKNSEMCLYPGERLLGITESESVSAKTRLDYRRRVQQFKREMRISLELAELKPEVLDKFLVKAYDDLYLSGLPFGAGEKLMAAVRFCVPAYSPHGKLSLPRSQRSLRGWRRLTPVATRRPLPWLVVAAIAWHFAMVSGEMAVAWLLMIDTYMRPSEAVNLEKWQVVPPADEKHMKLAAVLLHPDQRGIASKTGQMNESLIIHRPWLSEILMQQVRLCRGLRLFDFNLDQMRRHFVQIAAKVGINQWNPVLYMARHTGASLDRLENRISLEEVRRRGRWAAESSVRRYEKRALVMEVFQSLTPEQKLMCRRFDRDLVPFLRRRLGMAPP